MYLTALKFKRKILLNRQITQHILTKTDIYMTG